MATTVSAVAAPPDRSISTPVAGLPTFEERWAAWQARGVAHDRAVRRKMTIAVPILLVLVVVIYSLLGR